MIKGIRDQMDLVGVLVIHEVQLVHLKFRPVAQGWNQMLGDDVREFDPT